MSEQLLPVKCMCVCVTAVLCKLQSLSMLTLSFLCARQVLQLSSYKKCRNAVTPLALVGEQWKDAVGSKFTLIVSLSDLLLVKSFSDLSAILVSKSFVKQPQHVIPLLTQAYVLTEQGGHRLPSLYALKNTVDCMDFPLLH